MKAAVVLVFLLLVILNLAGILNSAHTKRTTNISLLIMLLLAVFKDGENMPDHLVYESAFNISNDGGRFNSMELSFYLLSRFFGLFGDLGFRFLLLFYSAIFIYGFRQLLVQYLDVAPLVILLFYTNAYFIFGLVQFRAGAALGVILLLVFSKFGNLKKIFTWSFAIFLHASAIVFIPLVAFVKRYKGVNAIVILLLGSILIRPYVIPMVTSTVGFVPNLYVQQKLLTYMLEERTDALSLNFLGVNFILRSAFVLIFLTYRKVFRSAKDRSVLLLFILGYVCYIALAGLPEVAFRIANSLFMLEVILLALIAKQIRPTIFRYAVVVLYSAFQLIVNLNFTSYFDYAM